MSKWELQKQLLENATDFERYVSEFSGKSN